MIKYILKCDKSHEFESWFSSSQEYDRLNKKQLISCIFCSSKKIKKSIMSPQVLNLKLNDQNEKVIVQKELKKIKKDLIKIKKFVEKNFEFVGDKFPEKVRNIYYENSGNKNIYGTVTKDESKELKEEGIELTSIPWVEDKEN